MAVGVAFPKDADAQIAYLQRLANRGLAAVALADRVTPRLSQRFLDTADDLEFPVFEVSWEVPFSEVARTVVAANQQSSQRRLMTHVHIFDSLRTSVVDGLTAAQLFARIEDLSGYDLYLATPRHEQLLPGVPAPPKADHPGAPDPARLCASRSGTRGRCRCSCGATSSGTWSRSSARGPRRRGWSPSSTSRPWRRSRSSGCCPRRGWPAGSAAGLLEDMLDGQLAPDGIRRRLVGEGFDDSERLVLFALRRRDDARPRAACSRSSADRCQQRGIPHLMSDAQPAFLLTPNGPRSGEVDRGAARARRRRQPPVRDLRRPRARAPRRTARAGHRDTARGRSSCEPAAMSTTRCRWRRPRVAGAPDQRRRSAR